MPLTMRFFTKSPLNIKLSEWTSNAITASLHNNTLDLLANQDTYDFFDDVASSQLANGNGYTQPGIALANKTITQDNATNEQRLDADDISWSVSGTGITWRWLVLTDRTPATDATRPLWAFGDPGADQSVPGGQTQTIQWSNSPAAVVKSVV